jgi:hypothetical protein
VDEQTTWARDTAAALLAPQGHRWAHTLGVAERARTLTGLLPEGELDVLLAAAYLHDVGYAPSLARTGLHPLDGARLLRALGRERLACLVAHHSGARAEAQERGLLDQLERFVDERSLVADALASCDLTTASSGGQITVSERLADIAVRYGDRDPVGRAIERSRHELFARVRAVERALRSRCPG